MARQVVYVKKQTSGCAYLALLVLILLVVWGYKPIKEGLHKAERAGRAKIEKLSKLTVTAASARLTPNRELLSSFTITNSGDASAMDFHLDLDAFAPSGTRVHHLKATLLDVVGAGESRRFEDISFERIDQQATTFSSPEIWECSFSGQP